ncbi:MAG: LamG-like jellyroll fold domain-containing protein [Candidatus Kapaibacterium sp.]
MLPVCLLVTCALAKNSNATNDRALQFTNSGYYSCPIRLDTLPQLTIEAWVRLDSSFQTGWPISFGGDSAGFGLFLYANLTPGFPSPLMIASGYQFPSVTGNSVLMPLGGWVHIAFTRDDTIWTLYRNGMLVGRGKLRVSFADSIIRIGQFSGALQQLRIWSFARSAEEIRADVYRQIADTERGLYASFSVDNATNVSIQDHVHGFVLQVFGDAGSITNIPSGLVFRSSASPKIIWKNLPAHLQFFPRDESGYGRIAIAGAVLEAGYDSIVIEKLRNDQLIARFSIPLEYSSDSANFELTDSIPAERSLYTYTTWCKRRDTMFYLAESADLVAGDVYIIDGQSNAHAAVAWFYWQVPYLRSFGVQTPEENFDPYDPADTSWGLANGNDWGLTYTSFQGPYMTGVWGMELQMQVLNNFGIPTCIINGATGGSTIEQHARSDSNRENLQSIYGKLLYRVIKAGCQNDVKAIFWDQGEFNTAAGYYQNFKNLYQDWQQDYPIPGLRKTYVLQVRPGCGPPGGSALREVQRTLPDSLPNIAVMSTVGIQGHDGCHFDAYGYVDIGNDLSRLIGRDYYGSTDTISIDAPNVVTAFYSRPDSSEIGIVLSHADSLSIIDDTPLGAHSEAMKDYFYLDGLRGMIQSAVIHHDSIQLLLSGHSYASRLTYLPDQDYNDTALIYEGPWIVNSRGIGLLSFDSVPILEYHAPANVPPAIPFAPFRVSIINGIFTAPTIEFMLPAQTEARVAIYDLLGRDVQQVSLISGSAGRYTLPVDLSRCRTAGVYIAVVRTSTEFGSAAFALP